MRVSFDQHLGIVSLHLEADTDAEAVLLAMLRNQQEHCSGRELRVVSSSHHCGKVGDRQQIISTAALPTRWQRLTGWWRRVKIRADRVLK